MAVCPYVNSKLYAHHAFLKGGEAVLKACMKGVTAPVLQLPHPSRAGELRQVGFTGDIFTTSLVLEEIINFD